MNKNSGTEEASAESTSATGAALFAARIGAFLASHPSPASISRLFVFDFDSTLFRSPEPSPALWCPRSTGWLMSSGWFHVPETLDPPGVPHSPGDEWFDETVLKTAREALRRNDTLCILLTGRRTCLTSRIETICRGVGLHFPLFFLREDPDEEGQQTFATTADFKRSVLRTILTHRAMPNLKEATLWDDRPAQLRQLTEELEHLARRGHIEKHESILVTHHERYRKYLEEAQEKQLVASLLASVSVPRPPRMKPLFQYVGILLDAPSRELLRTLPDFHRDYFTKLTGDHVTLSLVPNDSQVIHTNGGLGRNVRLLVYAVGEIPGKVLAVRVKRKDGGYIRTKSRVPHITIGLGKEGRARMSNDIRDWVSLDTPIEIGGVVGEKWVETVVTGK